MRKIILFGILALLLVTAYFIGTGSYSDGDRAGTISKLSHRGYVFKTWEGVLNEGGYSGETGTLTPRYWEFSVSESKDSVIVKLQKALSTGERITLKYEEKFFQFPWNGDSKYFLTDVQFIHHSQAATPAIEVIPRADSTKIDTVKTVK